jgi:hypothetical protein
VQTVLNFVFTPVRSTWHSDWSVGCWIVWTKLDVLSSLMENICLKTYFFRKINLYCTIPHFISVLLNKLLWIEGFLCVITCCSHLIDLVWGCTMMCFSKGFLTFLLNINCKRCWTAFPDWVQVDYRMCTYFSGILILAAFIANSSTALKFVSSYTAYNLVVHVLALHPLRALKYKNLQTPLFCFGLP